MEKRKKTERTEGTEQASTRRHGETEVMGVSYLLISYSPVRRDERLSLTLP
jgi:hypothetical protein